MKITKEDKDLFDNLSNSQMGRQLLDYLDRLSDNICDARNWGEGDTKESTTKAAQSIKKHISDKITFKKQPAPRGRNDYE